MRVMILTADYPPRVWSGIGVAVELQARALASIGLEVHVLVACRNCQRTIPAAGAGEPQVHYLTGDRFPLAVEGFDLIHLHSLALSELAFELRRRFRLPLIYTAHSLVHLELQDSQMAAFWAAVQGRVMALSDHVIFLSESERTAAARLMGAVLSRSTVIPNAVAPPCPSRRTATDDGPIVFSGRFVRSKGLETLAQVVPRVLARSQRSRFVLAGGHGNADTTGTIRQLAQDYGDGCTMVGWLDRAELDQLYAQAALVLIPSLYEPFGMVALEAMRMGAPVLGAAVGGLAEVLTRDSGGVLLDSHEPEQWSEAVGEMLSDTRELQALRNRGPAYVATRFNPALIAGSLVNEVYAG
jgi:glycosyltransferase involved in cell wall biosynthesis